MTTGKRSAAADRSSADAGGTGRRFYLPDAGTTGSITVQGGVAHRMLRVVRLRPGDRIEVFDGSGRSWPATIAAAQRDVVRLSLGELRRHPPEPRTMLLAALMRPNRFEWLVEKATELGVSVIQPVITERSSVRPAEIGPARLERWRRIAAEAAEQCGRVTIPEIRSPLPHDNALTAAEGMLLIAAELTHGPAPSLGALVREIGRRPLTILTGPEGGLTAEELRRAVQAGGCAASLGPLTLRAETAALSALAIVTDARLAGQSRS